MRDACLEQKLLIIPYYCRQRIILVHIYLKFSSTIDFSFKSSRS